MLKLVATAAVAVAVVTGMPTVSQACHERARDGDCRICKAMTDMRARATRTVERTARATFTWPKLERAPRDSLFKLAPREARPAVRVHDRERTTRRLFTWPKLERAPREPLFKLAPREHRPVFTRESRAERATRSR
jgi:hypothetical protein